MRGVVVRPASNHKIYDARWERFRRAWFADPDHHKCAHCHKSVWLCRDHLGRLLPPHLDHIKRLADGGDKYDPANLQQLCHACHARKSAQEMRGIAPSVPGCDGSGIPTDPNHPWRRSS
jgi:5-methylcytosine-specific restriction endonuclease McrA